MSEEFPKNCDMFELVHSFVTASLQDELTNDEVEDFERLLQDNPDARQAYARYIETTLLIPRHVGHPGRGGRPVLRGAELRPGGLLIAGRQVARARLSRRRWTIR